LDLKIQKIESELSGQDNAIALDYIIKRPNNGGRDAFTESRRNALTVIFKNAVMVHWIKIKEKRK